MMLRTALSAAITGLFLSTASFAQTLNVDPVDTVKVNLDMTAMTNKAAAARYSTLADDINFAIMAQVADRMASPGINLTVDISTVELSNGYTEALGAADTHLVGTVNVDNPINNAKSRTFELVVDVNSARDMLPKDTDVTILTASSDVFYKAMVAAFAKNVVIQMDN